MVQTEIETKQIVSQKIFLLGHHKLIPRFSSNFLKNLRRRLLFFILPYFMKNLQQYQRKWTEMKIKFLFGSRKIGAGGDENLEMYLLYGLMDFLHAYI